MNVALCAKECAHCHIHTRPAPSRRLPANHSYCTAPHRHAKHQARFNERGALPTRFGRAPRSLNSRGLRPSAASGAGQASGATGVTSRSQVALELRGAGERWLVGLGASRTVTPQARGFPHRRFQGRGEFRLFLPEQPAHETLVFPRAVVGHHAAPAWPRRGRKTSADRLIRNGRSAECPPQA